MKLSEAIKAIGGVSAEDRMMLGRGAEEAILLAAKTNVAFKEALQRGSIKK